MHMMLQLLIADTSVGNLKAINMDTDPDVHTFSHAKISYGTISNSNIHINTIGASKRLCLCRQSSRSNHVLLYTAMHH